MSSGAAVLVGGGSVGLRPAPSVEAAFLAHRDDVYRYLLRRTSDPWLAEDLTQDVFAAAVKAAPSVAADQPLLPWLYAVARRRLADELRARGRRPAAVSLEQADEVADSRPRLSARAVGALVSAVKSLPPSQRRVVVLRLFEGRTFAEIAVLLATSEVACRMRLERALSVLETVAGVLDFV
jgi:RNA polymerase sigma factor (sigma-70 family)